MEFIDRGDEQRLLRRALDAEGSKFIVIYGRRRLGKSTLIKRVLKNTDVYFEAGLNERAVQIAMMARAVATVYERFDAPIYSDWEDAIMAFSERCEKNSTLVLDEFPYMVGKDAALPSALQRMIDSGKLRCNIIVCGSSQRMMQKIILDSSEPLYGRADVKLNLRPILPQYWEQAMGLGAKAAVEEYSVWGGVPRYWNLREGYESLNDAVHDLILSEHGVLFNEPNSLFLDDTADIAPYSSIMTAIGRGNQRYSSIAEAIGKKTAELYKPMGNLVEMHYVRREVPFGENDEKSKKTLYKIDDPFMAFYYKFVEPNKSAIAIGRTDYVGGILERDFPMHIAGVWERLCQVAVSGNRLFGHTWKMAGRWWGKAPIFEAGRKTPAGFEDLEFDVVAEDFDDKNTILVGECKWASADYADRLLEKLKHKVGIAPFAQGMNVVYALFLREKPLSSAACATMLPEDVLLNLPE